MTDALQADVSAGPTSDALTEQPETRAIETKTQAEEPKAEPKKSPEEQRSDAVKKAVEKTLTAEEPKADAPKPAKPGETAPKAAEAAPKAAEPKPEAQVAEPAAEPRQTAFKDAPQRFDDHAKREWETVPESVRGAVHRSLREAEQGIEKYRGGAERYDTVFRQFDDIARQHNADPQQALGNYIRLDRLLRQDLVGGLSEIVAAQGLRGANGQPVTLRDIAASILGQTPNQATSRQEAANMELRQQVASLQQQLGGVTNHVQAQQHDAQRASLQTVWDNFVTQNPRAPELEAHMKDFLQKYPAGNEVSPQERLADAYAFASAKFPASTVAHTDAPALAQTQAPIPNPAGRKSISGAPRGETASSPKKLSRREAIDKAMREIGI